MSRLPVLLLAVCLPAAAQDAAAVIRTEIQRLQQSLKDRPWSGTDFASLQSTSEDQLKAAATALDAGHIYLSLEKLAYASDLVRGAQNSLDKAPVVKNSLPAFEAEWSRTSLALSALEPGLRATNWSQSPAALRALSETALIKTTPHLEGARGFATATRPNDGLFYLGQAQSQAAFSRLCASLNLPRPGRPLGLRSLLPELQSLQEKTNAAFQPPRSIEQHSRFIALNSAIKLARELDAAKFYAGALYQYLEAVRHYTLLDPSAPSADLPGLRSKLDASSEDASIAQIFLERGESDAVTVQVLSAFFAVRNPASPLGAPSDKTVELTLVRWPYT